MRAGPECPPCLRGLVRTTVRNASGDDGPLAARALEAACAELRRSLRANPVVPTRVATRCQRLIRRLCNHPDPFFTDKEKEFRAGRAAAERLGVRLSAPRGGLLDLLRFAILGNRIDFFKDLCEVEREWSHDDVELVEGDQEDLVPLLEIASSALFLTDNAGELPFDLPLIRALESRGCGLTVAVKGEPSQNDLTRADVDRFGVSLPRLVDTGTDAVGCELDQVGTALRRVWDEADLVLAKGMANYETLTEYPEALEGKPVYFLLVAKCAPVAASLGVAIGDAVIRRGTPASGRSP